ncbi:phage capsid protein [uncultured Methylobacterium sp.]|uniref:phage capsid protein n=1 Tax=uncultured Methylobacterium sp. TaxID=157278 RepID=UPI0035CAE791
MADTSYSVQYRDEFIAGFEQGMSQLSTAVTNDAQTKGNQAVFDIVDSGGASAVTRGVNGLIPARADNETQVPITLQEWHDKPRKTGFNMFASQGDGRAKMQMSTRKVMNRKIDDDIIAALNLATNSGTGGAATLALVQNLVAKLGRQDVDVDDDTNMFALATLAFRAELYQIKEFNSHDWVEDKPLVGPVRKVLRWNGINWIFSNRLPGAGTANEKCFIYHRAAVGHVANMTEAKIVAGYNEEDDYSFARSSIFMGSAVLQNKGILSFPHDGSAIG